MNDILKKYKILSFFGLPIFVVETAEQEQEIRTIIKSIFKVPLGVKTGIKVIKLKHTRLENFWERKLERTGYSIKETIIGIFAFIFITPILFYKHLFRIAIAKKMEAADIEFFHENTVKFINYRKQQVIERLSGIGNE